MAVDAASCNRSVTRLCLFGATLKVTALGNGSWRGPDSRSSPSIRYPYLIHARSRSSRRPEDVCLLKSALELAQCLCPLNVVPLASAHRAVDSLVHVGSVDAVFSVCSVLNAAVLIAFAPQLSLGHDHFALSSTHSDDRVFRVKCPSSHQPSFSTRSQSLVLPRLFLATTPAQDTA
jgi:hypothetical protein